jgi:hypothetical protein
LEKTNSLEYICCIWDDSVTHGSGWIDIDDIDVRPYLIPSVGLLIDETDDYIVIATASKEDQVMSPLQIPKKAIKKIKRHKFNLKVAGLWSE